MSERPDVGRGKPPLAPSSATTSDASTASQPRSFDESSTHARASTSLNPPRQASYEPHPEIATPQPNQALREDPMARSYARQRAPWQFDDAGRRPSESSEDSELHPRNLSTTSQPGRHFTGPNPNDHLSYPHQRQRYGAAFNSAATAYDASRSAAPPRLNHPVFDNRAVFDDIALPTVDSILANAPSFGRHPGGDGSGGGGVGSGGPAYLINSSEGLQARHQQQTTRSSYQPSFADFNLAQQQQQSVRRAYAAAASAASGIPPSVLNSVAASPSLVSALHALQKRCRRLEEENQVLHESVVKETNGHVDSRGKQDFLLVAWLLGSASLCPLQCVCLTLLPCP